MHHFSEAFYLLFQKVLKHGHVFNLFVKYHIDCPFVIKVTKTIGCATTVTAYKFTTKIIDYQLRIKKTNKLHNGFGIKTKLR